MTAISTRRVTAAESSLLIAHMSTATSHGIWIGSRQAVGDAKLSYYGVSYGSMLGQTYANMFPGNFRALVIDGVLDPIAWTTGAAGEQGLTVLDAAAQRPGRDRHPWEEFFRLCDEGVTRLSACWRCRRGGAVRCPRRAG